MTLLDLARLLRKNIGILLLCTVLGAGAALAWTWTRPEVYRASAVGLVVAGDTSSVANATMGDQFARARADAYVNLIGTRAVGERVQADLGAQGIPVGSYSASTSTGTTFITVSASAATPESASATADAALRALTAEALRVETYAQTQGEERPTEELLRLTAIHILPYQPATQPTTPDRPNLVRNVLLGAAAGLLLGLVISVVRRQLDTNVRTKEDVEELTGHAVLGVIPDSALVRKQRSGKLVTQPLTGHVGEAMRKLRTNLRFVHVDDPVRTLVVTSANPSEGKSSIAANLAKLVALSGQSVVLVDCDLRRPSQATIFGVDSSLGLSQVLAGDLPVGEAMIQTEVPGLRLLPAGRVPPNPSELAGSRKMADLVEQLSRDSMVIIDSPPMLAVTDAALLAAASDGAIFVAVAGKTPKDQVRVCADQLEMVGAGLLGTVLNRVPKRSLGDATYGYGRTYYSSRNEVYYSSAKQSGPESEVVLPGAPAGPGVASEFESLTSSAQAPRARRGVRD
ncbi:polysaccharide biosynthesis tyrosine autokinase [Aestuariimicrobium sp. Y1814]|uniref:polysaccharide biosynthesis tyrosine autokinase n=1 Tax=Aestuariimicrobium sp. Y1814 TaxID=3418742 RepID=UPI003DA7179F